jgi:hypothetical protein
MRKLQISQGICFNMSIYNVFPKNNKPADPRLLFGKYAVRVSAEIKARLRVSIGLVVLSGSILR